MFNFFKSNDDYRDLTVYVVDDDPDMLSFLVHHFSKKWRIEVKTFDCVKKVVSAIKEAHVLPSLIISDIKLPEQSGLVLQNIVGDIPIIFITSLDGENIEDEKYTIIGKPINKKHFDELIQKKLAIT